MSRAVATLRSGGAAVQPAALESDIADVLARHRRVMAVEAAEYHRPWFPERRAEYGRWIAALLDEGWNTTAIDYAAALRQQTEFQIEVLLALADADALILPSTVTPAPGVETTGDPRFNSLWSYCGLPTVTVSPARSVSRRTAAGLCSWSAGPIQEGNLLAVAAWCEKCLNFTAAATLELNQ